MMELSYAILILGILFLMVYSRGFRYVAFASGALLIMVMAGAIVADHYQWWHPPAQNSSAAWAPEDGRPDDCSMKPWEYYQKHPEAPHPKQGEIWHCPESLRINPPAPKPAS
jgi:hypothetical protein